MKQYQQVMRDVLETGNVKGDRTGTGTISKFGGMMKFDIRNGGWAVPTTRKVAYEKIAEELEWMIKGMISVEWLNDHNNKIWNSWVGANGTIGPMYGEQWRNWNATVSKQNVLAAFDAEVKEQSVISDFDPKILNGMMRERLEKLFDEKTKPYEQGGRGGTDQLQYVVDELNLRPDSRRICVNVWHAGILPDSSLSPSQNVDVGNMSLAPCHSMWQVETSTLSQMELLREAYWEQANSEDKDLVLVTAMDYSIDFRQAIMNRAMSGEGLIALVLPEEELENVLGAFKRVVNHHTSIMPKLLRDSSFTITAKGQELIDNYIALGRPTRKLSLLCFARSQDLPLGTAYNVGMYSLLAHILASLTNMVPWEYTHFMGDHHIYSNQVEGVKEQLSREPMQMPRVIIDPTLKSIDDFSAKNLTVFYKSHPAIKFPMAAV